MRVRIMEDSPARLRDLAQSWGVAAVEGQPAAVVSEAIAAAYRREVEAEERRIQAARLVRRLREAG